MAMLSDLKWQLVTVGYGEDVVFIHRIKVHRENHTDTELKEVILKGKCWKVLDIWNQEYTISSISTMIQSQIFSEIRSMRDKRHPFTQTTIYTI